MKEYRRALRRERKRFPLVFRDKPAEAHISLASAHNALVENLPGSARFQPLRLWHDWQAARHAYKGYKAAGRVTLLTVDDVNKLSHIWARVPKRLGGKPSLAVCCLEHVLSPVHRDFARIPPDVRRAMTERCAALKSRGFSMMGLKYEIN